MSPPQRRQKPLFPRGAQSATKSPPARAGDKAPRGERRGRTERSEAGKGEPPPPTRSPGAAQGKASEDAPQRAEPRPGKGRGDQRGQSTAAKRKGARRAHGSTLAQSEERRPRREGQGERGNARHPGAGAARPPEPQRRQAMASRTRGGDGTSRTPARGAYILCLAAAIGRRKAQAARGRSPRSGLTSAHPVPAPAPKTTQSSSTGKASPIWGAATPPKSGGGLRRR